MPESALKKTTAREMLRDQLGRIVGIKKQEQRDEDEAAPGADQGAVSADRESQGHECRPDEDAHTGSASTGIFQLLTP